MKKRLLATVLFLQIVQCQQDYTRNGRMPLWQRVGIATLSVGSNVVMGGLGLNELFKYLIKNPTTSLYASLGTAGVVALINEYVQLKDLYENCKLDGEYAYKNNYSWANEDRYSYNNERYYYEKTGQSIIEKAFGACFVAGIWSGIVYVTRRDSEIALQAFMRAASKLYWICKAVDAMTPKINF